MPMSLMWNDVIDSPSPVGKRTSFSTQSPLSRWTAISLWCKTLRSPPMGDLPKIYPSIKARSKTVFVVHEGKPPKDPAFYQFEWDAVICFDERYRRFLKHIYPEDTISIIPYPCHPIVHGDKIEAWRKLDLPLDKKIIFNYGIGVYRHLHLLPTIKRVNRDYPLILLTMTHIQDWYELFDAVRGIYPFIDLRKGDIPMRELYTYLHAADALLVHKDSAEAIVVPSTAYLCLGVGCPILAYDTNFFETFGKEVVKYSELGAALKEVFEGRDNIKSTSEAAEQFVRRNSSEIIAERFIGLFESLFSPRHTDRLPDKGNVMEGRLSPS